MNQLEKNTHNQQEKHKYELKDDCTKLKENIEYQEPTVSQINGKTSQG